jgi:PKD repeat protein
MDDFTAHLARDDLPSGSFTVDYDVGYAPLTVRFTDTSANMNADMNRPVSYAWDFGDGPSNSTARNPDHTYTSVGNYTVSLTVTNVAGSSSCRKVISVVEGSCPLVNFGAASFTINEDGGHMDIPITSSDAQDADMEIVLDAYDGPAQNPGMNNVNYDIPATVTMPAHETTVNLAVGINDTPGYQGDLKFRIGLGRGNGYTVGPANSTNVTILDTDSPPAPGTRAKFEPVSGAYYGQALHWTETDPATSSPSTWETTTGHNSSVVLGFRYFSERDHFGWWAPFPAGDHPETGIANVGRRGETPMITWQPDYDNSTDNIHSIAAGDFDELVLGAMAELSDNGMRPEGISLESVLQLADSIRQTQSRGRRGGASPG